MTTFCLIRPAERLVHLADATTFNSALESIGLTPNAIDFGILPPPIHIIVDEWSLKHHAIDSQYWTICSMLFNGPALLYQTDIRGVTIDFFHPVENIINNIKWFSTASEVEAAITRFEVRRPQIIVNGRIIEEWREGKWAGLD